MAKLTLFLISATAIMLFTFGKKEKAKDPLLRTYTVTLDMRPSQNNAEGKPISLDNTKSIFLSLSNGKLYNIADAKANAATIDLVVYDGSTTPTGTGNVHLISPGGGTLSLKAAPGSYKFLSPGTKNAGVQYFSLTGMENWSAYNTTAIRDETGLNGVDVAYFDRMERLSQFKQAVNKVKQPGTNNSNQAKKIYDVAKKKPTSTVWYFEFQSGKGTKIAFAKLTHHRYLPDGFLEFEVKMPQ